MVENTEKSEFVKEWTKLLLTLQLEITIVHILMCILLNFLFAWCKELSPDFKWLRQPLYIMVFLLEILCRALDIMPFIFPLCKMLQLSSCYYFVLIKCVYSKLVILVFAIWMLNILYIYYHIDLSQQHFVVVIILILLMWKVKVRGRGITIVHQHPFLLSFWTHVNCYSLPYWYTLWP